MRIALTILNNETQEMVDILVNEVISPCTVAAQLVANQLGLDYAKLVAPISLGWKNCTFVSATFRPINRKLVSTIARV